jgi:ABC-type sugar transport system ATPase subunit
MLAGTVYDNIDFGLKIQGKGQRAEKIARVLKQLDISHCADSQAKLLSGGELQKAALARSLVLEPEVLLLIFKPKSILSYTVPASIKGFWARKPTRRLYSIKYRLLTYCPLKKISP